MARYTEFGDGRQSPSDPANHVDMDHDGGQERGNSPDASTRQRSPTAFHNPFYTGRPRTTASGSKAASIDRQEIIRRIKSGESRPTSPEVERMPSRTPQSSRKLKSPTPESSAYKGRNSPRQSSEAPVDNMAMGMQIERPRSALHRGDFREKEESRSAFHHFRSPERNHPLPALSTSPVAPWHSNFPTAAFCHRHDRPSKDLSRERPIARARTASNASLASCFVYKPPTSPLVQDSRPDTPEPDSRQLSPSPDKSRRHTYSPRALQRFQSALEYPSSTRTQNNKHPPSLRSERTHPYQAHQPRRSLNSFSNLPQSPPARTRWPSFAETPLQHAPMVGSYEESILRGRMSTTPSKPLNFVAQIGVLGKGDCKANLRCPPHATVPFPAVFYSYGVGTTPSGEADQPSPYVGLVDLENSLPSVSTSPDQRRHRTQDAKSHAGSRASSRTREETCTSDIYTARRRRQKQKRRSDSPKAPPGGSYRIPQKGQLQIVIKNPNKTAVKLFLVPYDLSDMEPGQKTFIRQRSYSAGPTIDMPISSRKNLGTDRPEAALSASDDPNERPTLRYLIHLHICCPAKGRYYLYKSIRVVFAHRVPDGKESLRNEIQLPEPRYSIYKPGRDGGASGGLSTPKDAERRRSANMAGAGDFSWQDQSSSRRRKLAQSLPSVDFDPTLRHSDISPTQPLPRNFPRAVLSTLHSRPASRQMSDEDEGPNWWPHTSEPFSPSAKRSARSIDVTGNEQHQDASHAPESPTSPVFARTNQQLEHERQSRNGRGRSESLLSRGLRGLGVEGEPAAMERDDHEV